MKTFSDLDFKTHPSTPHFKTQARLDFNNGYGVSVITGDAAYSSESSPYEVAVMFDGEICYDTPITDDVIGYQDEQGVTDLMKRVQEL